MSSFNRRGPSQQSVSNENDAHGSDQHGNRAAPPSVLDTFTDREYQHTSSQMMPAQPMLPNVGDVGAPLRSTASSQMIMNTLNNQAMHQAIQRIMSYIHSTEGQSGLQYFLSRMPTQLIETRTATNSTRMMYQLNERHSQTNSLLSSSYRAAHAGAVSSLSTSNSLQSPSTPSNMMNRASHRRAALKSDSSITESSFDSLNNETGRLFNHPMSLPATQQDQSEQPTLNHATSLFVPSDHTFLDPVHNFIRCNCIEVFIATKDDIMAPGRGSHPAMIGQVGLRCVHCKNVPRQKLARQAVCFPSKRDTIFEGVRNYQRVHLEACSEISDEMKAQFKNLVQHENPSTKKSHKFIKAYYAEAASELGLIDTPHGLVFGSPPNLTGMPSGRLSTLIRAAENPSHFPTFWEAYFSGKNDALERKKFEHVASDATRRAIVGSKNDQSAFVHPEDYTTMSDEDFLLFHQFTPCMPSPGALNHRGQLVDGMGLFVSGLCCKHCARNDIQTTKLFFPTNLHMLADSSFYQMLIHHVMGCPRVPQEIKDALDELIRLAVEHGIKTKRGSKKNFMKKLWTRMENYYERNSDVTR